MIVNKREQLTVAWMFVVDAKLLPRTTRRSYIRFWQARFSLLVESNGNNYNCAKRRKFGKSMCRWPFNSTRRKSRRMLFWTPSNRFRSLVEGYWTSKGSKTAPWTRAARVKFSRPDRYLNARSPRNRKNWMHEGASSRCDGESRFDLTDGHKSREIKSTVGWWYWFGLESLRPHAKLDVSAFTLTSRSW